MRNIFTRLFLLLAILLLTSCSGGNCGAGGGATTGITLSLDQVSAIPLINNKPQNFYVYANNIGATALSNIAWTIDSSTELNSSTLQKARSKLNHLVAANDESQAIIIKDTSECESIAALQSCRILLQANFPGVYQLHAVSGSIKVSLMGGAGIVQSDRYTPINTGDLADTLTMTSLSEISYNGGIGSGSFFIINNGESSVNLDLEALKAGLPANASIVLGECPNPLPSGNACQVRIVITNPTNSTSQDLVIPITLAGDVINQDGSMTTLPKQNGDGDIKATSQVKGILQYSKTLSVVIDNSFLNVTKASVSGILSNTGSGSLSISSLVPNGDVLSIASDTCSGKTLGQGDVCNYTLNLDVSKITNSNSELITINYMDISGSETKSVNSSVSWTYIPPLPVASPAISMTISSNTLTQLSTTTSIIIENTGNVDLSDITVPTMTPANPHLSITNSTISPCAGTLAIGASCNYTVTYTPVAPSENMGVVFGGVSATHPDNRGSTATTSLSGSVGVNVSSIFEGILSSSGVVSLHESATTGSITFTNIGSDNATISGLTWDAGSSSNLVLRNDSSTCATGTNLAPTQSCTVTIGLLNSIASGSGNGTLIATYDNHNGTTTATSSNADISWLIGNAPSLRVVFASNNLISPVTLESSTLVTLTNNGRDVLTDITIPTLTAPLAYTSGMTNGCAVDGSQDLAINESCSIILTYSPTTAQVSRVESLPSFSSTYDNGGGVASYTTNPYAITLEALSLGDLTAEPSSVTQNVNWVQSSQTSEVVIKNTGGIPVTIDNINSNQAQVTASGCNGILQANESCVLNVMGNYSASLNSTITIDYTDASGSDSMIINVTGNYVAMPVITASLAVNAPSLFNDSIYLGLNESSSYAVELINNTTSTNNGNESLSILYASLMPSNGATYSINTDGITNNPCSLPSVGNSMILPANATCNYHLVITAGNSVAADAAYDMDTYYSYYDYSGGLIPVFTAEVTPVTNTFNLEVKSLAQLSIAIVDGEEDNFDNIESGLASPTMGIEITNTGTSAVSGSITASLPTGITISNLGGCDDLGVGSTCTATLTMETTSTISGNLNTSTLNYNDTHANTTADFPSVVYSVITPEGPILEMYFIALGCNVGEGVGANDTCMANPNAYGGTAANILVGIAFVNTGSVDANSISLQAAESALFATADYRMIINDCDIGAVAGDEDGCLIGYSISPNAGTGPLQPNIIDADFKYDYTYTTDQGQSLSGVGTGNMDLNIDIVNPTIAISAIESVTQGTTKPVTITLSNLYQANTPTVSVNAETAGGGAISGVTVSPTASCGSISSVTHSASCSSSIVAGAGATTANDHVFNASMFTTLTSQQTFSIVQPLRYYIYVTQPVNGASVLTACNTGKPTGSTATYSPAVYNTTPFTNGRTYTFWYNNQAQGTWTASGTSYNQVNSATFKSVIQSTLGTQDTYGIWLGSGNSNDGSCSVWTAADTFGLALFSHKDTPANWTEQASMCNIGDQMGVVCVVTSGSN